MDIATKTNNISSAEEFAQKLIRIGESLTDLKIYAEVLLKVKKVFFEAKNVAWIEKSFDRLLKICKKGKNELKQTLALVHSEYGKYQELVVQNSRNAKKHYEEAIKIYKSLGLSKEITELQQTLEEMKKGKK
jgi:thiaminase